MLVLQGSLTFFCRTFTEGYNLQDAACGMASGRAPANPPSPTTRATNVHQIDARALSEDYGSVSWRGPSVQAAQRTSVVAVVSVTGHVNKSGPHLLCCASWTQFGPESLGMSWRFNC